MNSVLLVIGSILAVLAAAIHVYIFVLESVVWSRPGTWRTFGLRSQESADLVKPMAFNQGFYNLFLAIATALGVILIGDPVLSQAGFALAFAGLGSMFAAALVLVISSPALARAASVQGIVPALAIVLLIAGIAV